MRSLDTVELVTIGFKHNEKGFKSVLDLTANDERPETGEI